MRNEKRYQSQGRQKYSRCKVYSVQVLEQLIFKFPHLCRVKCVLAARGTGLVPVCYDDPIEAIEPPQRHILRISEPIAVLSG